VADILVVNAGSSSLKLAVLDAGDLALVDARTIESWDGSDVASVGDFVRGRSLAAVGHRIVHGGETFTAATCVDDVVRARIAALTPLAPLHQPRGLAALDAARKAVGVDVPHVACFDTAFHSTLPPAAATYALPREWRERFALRRFGFHGLSHAYAARRTAELVGRSLDELAIVTCHLGAGASLCAVLGGRSVDTTMGFTPLEGLVMATRSGSVDPGLVLWLLGQGCSVADVSDGLERRGGLRGLAGTDDLRVVLDRRAHGDTIAALAVDVYVYSVTAHLAAMVAALGRLDAVAFTGGVGEHAPAIRAEVARRAGFLGLRVDDDANDAATADARITRGAAPVETVVVTAREDVEMAREVRAVVARTSSP
jgi:acetate kinase